MNLNDSDKKWLSDLYWNDFVMVWLVLIWSCILTVFAVFPANNANKDVQYKIDLLDSTGNIIQTHISDHTPQQTETLIRFYPTNSNTIITWKGSFMVERQRISSK